MLCPRIRFAFYLLTGQFRAGGADCYWGCGHTNFIIIWSRFASTHTTTECPERFARGPFIPHSELSGVVVSSHSGTKIQKQRGKRNFETR